MPTNFSTCAASVGKWKSVLRSIAAISARMRGESEPPSPRTIAAAPVPAPAADDDDDDEDDDEDDEAGSDDEPPAGAAAFISHGCKSAATSSKCSGAICVCASASGSVHRDKMRN